MDWTRVGVYSGTDNPEYWIGLFQEKPEALYDLLYDVYATKKGKLGRGRRKKMNGSLDDLWALIYGEN